MLKITMHKIVSTSVILVLAITKAIYGYNGDTVASNTMDWLLGIPLAIW